MHAALSKALLKWGADAGIVPCAVGDAGHAGSEENSEHRCMCQTSAPFINNSISCNSSTQSGSSQPQIRP